MKQVTSIAALVIAACSAPLEAPASSAAIESAPREAVDDGSYLSRIDPLGGAWQVKQIGDTDFTTFKGGSTSAKAGSSTTAQAAAAGIRPFTSSTASASP